MSEMIAWLALVVWLAALSLRVHPRARAWACRGSSAATAPQAVPSAPALPVPRSPREPVDPADDARRPPVPAVHEMAP